MNTTSRVLFISDNSIYSQFAHRCVAAGFSQLRAVLYERLDYPKPALDNWEGDWIICFKCDYIVPEWLLKRARKGCINFHPGPPHYRGVGTYVWAVKNRDEEYGVTCHHVVKKLDAGEIIKVHRFPIFPGESSTMLKERTAIYLMHLLNEILPFLVWDKPLPQTEERWGEKLYIYRDLEELYQEP